MTITEDERATARGSARHAARNRLPMTVCPYRDVADDSSRALAGIWTREYLRNSPATVAAVDYTA